MMITRERERERVEAIERSFELRESGVRRKDLHFLLNLNSSRNFLRNNEFNIPLEL